MVGNIKRHPKHTFAFKKHPTFQPFPTMKRAYGHGGGYSLGGAQSNWELPPANQPPRTSLAISPLKTNQHSDDARDSQFDEDDEEINCFMGESAEADPAAAEQPISQSTVESYESMPSKQQMPNDSCIDKAEAEADRKLPAAPALPTATAVLHVDPATAASVTAEATASFLAATAAAAASSTAAPPMGHSFGQHASHSHTHHSQLPPQPRQTTEPNSPSPYVGARPPPGLETATSAAAAHHHAANNNTAQHAWSTQFSTSSGPAASTAMGTESIAAAASSAFGRSTETKAFSQAVERPAPFAPVEGSVLIPPGTGIAGSFPSSTNAQAFAAPAPPPPLQASLNSRPSGVPKAELHSFYGKPPRRKILSNDNYCTWHNSGQAHMLRWTSVFVCPMTGELFMSARFEGAEPDGPSIVSSEKNVWFAKKTQAEHGAAARAFDCFAYRDQVKNNPFAPVALYGTEAPYLEHQAIFTLPHDMYVPSDVLAKIRSQQAEVRGVS